MIDLQKRIDAFAELGRRLATLPDWQLDDWSRRAMSFNGWFTPESVKAAINGIVAYLEPAGLQAWAARYPIESQQPKTIGIVMAGNIPLVGMHDMLCVLICGHTLQGKLSSQDPFLPKAVMTLLTEIEPGFANKIHFVERLQGFNAVIATGSNNSARYFDFYFSKYPHIIRKNRHSCAILKGDEPEEELRKLGSDIFLYYGLGCRNVSKLYVPEGYNFSKLLDSTAQYKEVANNHKYNNNYDYHKAVFLVNSIPHLDTGYLLLNENEALSSPISVVYYEQYSSEQQLVPRIEALREELQCIVSHQGWFPGSIPTGTAQEPRIDDYADGVDTMAFLTGLK